MAYPFESSIQLTNSACQLVFASGNSYISESPSGQLNIVAGSGTAMTFGQFGFTAPGLLNYMTNLPSNDTEDHLIAINDSSGGLTKRSVASIKTTINNQADNRLITCTATADTLNGEANLTYHDGTFSINPFGDDAITALAMYRDFASGSVGQSFILKNDADEWVNYGSIGAFVEDDTDGAEYGYLQFYYMVNGSSGGWVKMDRYGFLTINDVAVTTGGKLRVNSDLAGGGSAYITHAISGDHMVFYDANNTGGLTLTQLYGGGGGALWTDNTTYVSPPAGYSVRTEGDTEGFFVDHTTQTGIEGVSNGSMSIYASGTEVARADHSGPYLRAYTEFVVQNNSSPGPILSLQGNVSNTIRTGDSSVTGNLAIKSGDASAGSSGHLYLYTGSATATKGSVYFGTGSAGSLNNDEAETNIVAYDTTTGLLSYRSVSSIGGGGYWDRTSTLLTTSTSGDDVALDSASKLYFDGGNDTYIHQPTDDILTIVVGTTAQMTFYQGGAGDYAEINCSLTLNSLGSDDTEDHVVAIDDSTGLLTKRSVASLGGGGVSWSGSTANAIGTYGDSSTINAEAYLTFSGGATSTLNLDNSGTAYPIWFEHAGTGGWLQIGRYNDTYITLSPTLVTSDKAFHLGESFTARPTYPDYIHQISATTINDNAAYVTVGNSSTSGTPVGELIFCNDASSETHKRVALIRAVRAAGGNNSGDLDIYTSDNTPSFHKLQFNYLGHLGINGNASTTTDVALKMYRDTGEITIEAGRSTTWTYGSSGTLSGTEGLIIRPSSYQTSDYTNVYTYSNLYGGIQFRRGTSTTDLRITYSDMDYYMGTTTTMTIRHSWNTSTYYVYGASSANIYIDAATTYANLYLQSAANYDSRIYFRNDTTTRFVMGYDYSLSVFQIHSSTSFSSTTGTTDFAIGTAGQVYMGNITSGTNTYYIRYNLTSGELTYYASDKRFKRDITVFEEDALGTLLKFNPKNFIWKSDSSEATGWIAQECVEYIPRMFPINQKTGFYGISEFEILPYFHKAIQQLHGIEKSHEGRIEKLEKKVKTLQSQVRKLMLNKKN